MTNEKIMPLPKDPDHYWGANIGATDAIFAYKRMLVLIECAEQQFTAKLPSWEFDLMTEPEYDGCENLGGVSTTQALGELKKHVQGQIARFTAYSRALEQAME